MSVATRLAADLASVEADRAQIERVILNLAANARDAMPDGGALTIETRNVELEAARRRTRRPGRTCCSPSPTPASAWSAEVRAHLFEPFFTTKQGGEGTGLGLATVFGVVKQSGGGIYVYSEPGSGTTFKIYLPAAVRPAERNAERCTGARAAWRGTETVLVVEDDPNVRDLVRLLLENNGYTVLTVQDADEAVRACTELGVDLLLTDVVMPEVSGRVLAERVADAAPSVRILFMSGYSDEAVHRHGVLGEQRGLHREAVHRARADPEGARSPRRSLKRDSPSSSYGAPGLRAAGLDAIDRLADVGEVR